MISFICFFFFFLFGILKYASMFENASDPVGCSLRILEA